jgi:hypothetical protein
MGDSQVNRWRALATILTLIIATPLRGFVLAKAWGWFLVPAGLRPVGVAQAIGISIFFALIAPSPPTQKDQSVGESVAISLLLPLVIWFAASVAHWFMA